MTTSKKKAMNAYEIEWKDFTSEWDKPQEDGTTEHYAIPAKEAVGTGLAYRIFNPQDDAPDDIPYYSIIHVQSGSGAFHRDPILVEDLAKRILVKVAALTDWTRSEQEMSDDPEYKNTMLKAVKIYRKMTKEYWEMLEETQEGTYWGE